jgi:hypothetical protein
MSPPPRHVNRGCEASASAHRQGSRPHRLAPVPVCGVFETSCLSPEGAIRRPHRAPLRLLLWQQPLRVTAPIVIEKNCLNHTEVFLGRPGSKSHRVESWDCAPASCQNVYSMKPPSRRASTSRCGRLYAKDSSSGWSVHQPLASSGKVEIFRAVPHATTTP